MNQYEVYPADGQWGFRLRSADGEVLHDEGAVGDRAAAIEAARAHRGDQREDLFRADGSKAGVLVGHRGPEALYIYNADGSIYGEVDHPIRPDNDGPAQVVSLGQVS